MSTPRRIWFQPLLDVLKQWPGKGRSRAAFVSGYVTAAIITALAVWLVASAPTAGPITPASQTLLLVLGLNLVLILGLSAVVGVRVLKLAKERRTDAGARLHMRFVTLFAAAAVAPAVVVALFFGVLVTRGVESWFSENVRTAVENGATIARSYVEQQYHREAPADLNDMAGDLEQVRPLFPNRITFSRALESLAQLRGFQGAYVLDSTGAILARAEPTGVNLFLTPPPGTLERAATGEMQVGVYGDPDAVRALYRLKSYDDAYLYVVRLLEPGILSRLRNSEQSIVAYRERERSRARVQAAFGLAYFETALLVLLGAVWLGMTAAGAISEPVARLVQAADRVASGDLTARVDTDRDPEEIAVLSRAFNRMTGDLQAQQEALKAASVDSQARRLFIETVLSGVSAGVIGLDAEGRASALNAQAQKLLGLSSDVLGQLLDTFAPELAEVAARGPDLLAETDVDITRGSETRRLRVRVSGSDTGGLVLTFDDITRLVTAQRNAAWRDVARRIAHEIKNPLTPIQLSAERLRRKYRDQVKTDLETFDRCTDTIVRQVGDIGRMVDEFSSFARMPAPKFAPEDAAELLREAVFAQRVAYPDVPVTLIEPTGGFAFVADGRMIGQALGNVLKNAGEAVASRRARDPGFAGGVEARLEHEGNGGLAFVIEDDGPGLPAKDRDRLTEPYVTTREKGTGLGLAIVKRICEDHGGEIELADASNRSGARVALKFPKALASRASINAIGATSQGQA